MKFEENQYVPNSQKSKYQNIEYLIEEIHQKVQENVITKYKNYQQEEIAQIALEVCTAVLLEFLKDRVNHEETF